MPNALQRALVKLAGLLVLGGAAVAWANPSVDRLAERRAELERLRRTPGGVVAIHDLVQTHWDWVPSRRIIGILDLARRRDSHPLVQGLGDLQAARAAWRQGRQDQAAALRLRAGVIPHWFLCGPLPSQGTSGHDEVFGVERDLGDWPRPSARYRGKPPARWVRWRRIPLQLHRLEGALPVGSFLGPERQEAVAYLQALVSAGRRQLAALRLGTGGSFKVFLNGRQLAAREVTRPARPDQDAIGLVLQPGTNRLVIKLTVAQGSWDLHARLTRPDGGRLEGITVLAATPATAALPAVEPRPVAVAVADPDVWLQRRLRDRPDDPLFLGDRARYLVRVTPTDPADRGVEELLHRWIQRAPSSQGYLLLARTRRDPDEERRMVRRALDQSPRDLWALLHLARLQTASQRYLEVSQLLWQILLRDPRFLPAELELADLYRTSGLEGMAAAVLDRAMRVHPRVGRVVLERANLALAQDDAARAEGLFRRYLALNAGDLSVRRTLADLALRRADSAGAVRELELAVQLAPQAVFLRMELAGVLEGRGELDRALAEYRRAREIDPWSVRVLERMGHALHRAGREPEARAAWRRALRLRPQNAELRAYLEFLDPRRTLGLAERFRLDPRPIVARARERRAKDASARVLLDLTATEVHLNGLSRTLRQRLVQVVTEAGAVHAASHLVQYNPDRQTVDVRVARVHRADGLVSQGVQREHGLNEPWAGLWYDLRALELRFAGLKPGDIVELEYLVEDVAEDNLFADYYGDIVHLQQELPVERFRYVLVTPKARAIHVRHPRSPGVTYAEQPLGRDHRVRRWTASEIPRVVREPGMPGWSEVADYVHVSTYRSWEEVGRWYWRLIERQLRPTRAVVEAARRATAGLATERGRIEAIHSYVAKGTRYVGLEFGIHSYKPYAAGQVLARRFGDCKDKAALMVALLAQIGVEAEIVLVRTRSRGAVERSPASVAPFTHALVYVPKHRLYLDATAELAGTRELPMEDQGVLALHVSKRSARLAQTPILPARDNTTRVAEKIVLAPSGDATISEQRTITGQAASQWRVFYQAADQRQQRYEKTWNEWVGSAKVLRVSMPGLDSLERPVTVAADVEVKGLARHVGQGRLSLLPGSGLEASLVQAYARLSSRVHPLVLQHPWRSVQQVRLVPPRGWSFATVPPPRVLRSPFGSYARSARRVGRELAVEQRVEIGVARVEAAQYRAFRTFLQQVDQLLAERVVLVRAR